MKGGVLPSLRSLHHRKEEKSIKHSTMGKLHILSSLLGGVAIFSLGTGADRACNANNASYLWRVSDARFDGVAPSVSDGKAVIAVSGESIYHGARIVSSPYSYSYPYSTFIDTMPFLVAMGIANTYISSRTRRQQRFLRMRG